MLSKQQTSDAERSLYALLCKRIASPSFNFYCISSVLFVPTLIAIALLLFGNEPGFYSWILRIMMAVSEHTPA